MWLTLSSCSTSIAIIPNKNALSWKAHIIMGIYLYSMQMRENKVQDEKLC